MDPGEAEGGTELELTFCQGAPKRIEGIYKGVAVTKHKDSEQLEVYLQGCFTTLLMIVCVLCSMEGLVGSFTGKAAAATLHRGIL